MAIPLEKCLDLIKDGFKYELYVFNTDSFNQCGGCTEPFSE